MSKKDEEFQKVFDMVVSISNRQTMPNVASLSEPVQSFHSWLRERMEAYANADKEDNTNEN